MVGKHGFINQWVLSLWIDITSRTDTYFHYRTQKRGGPVIIALVERKLTLGLNVCATLAWVSTCHIDRYVFNFEHFLKIYIEED